MAWFRKETDGIKKSMLAGSPLIPTSVVLRGRIVTMDDGLKVIQDGYLCISGNSISHCGSIDEGLPENFVNIGVIETNGTIYPGLFELHNHPSYNILPLWDVPSAFSNRKQWRKHTNYYRFVSNPATLLTHDPTSKNARAVIRFVECRALLGGVTTTQGLSIRKMGDDTKAAYSGLVRNVEFPDDKTWPIAEDRIDDFKAHEEAEDLIGPILGDARYKFIMHLSEGTDDDARAVFDLLKRPNDSWLIGPNFVGVHATGLDPARMTPMAKSAGIVWSPLSNLLLYGKTTDIAAAVAAGVPIALGSDWAPSGTKNLLGELKIAKIVSDHLGGLFKEKDLVQMVTSTPARMMGWGNYLGTLEVGKLADCLVLEGISKDPYAQLIESTEADIVAVMINGRPRMGRAALIDPTTPGVEIIRVAMQDIVLDIVESEMHPLAGVSLASAISTLSYALAHLPDLADQFLAQHRLMESAEDRFYVELDMDEDYAKKLMAGNKDIGRDDVESMQLMPITEYDDSQFRARIKLNINIPEWLRLRL